MTRPERLVACVVLAVAGCTSHSTPAPESPAQTPSPRAVASSAPAQAVAPAPLASAQADVVRESFRQLTESYVALVRSGQLDEAWRYLPKDLQQRIPEAAHAMWWRRAVSAADLPRIYVGAVAVETGGGIVSVVTPARSFVLRVIGAEKPGVVPLDLLAPKAALPSGIDWLPLVAGTLSSFAVQRETVTVSSLATDLGKPEWRDRVSGVLNEEVAGPSPAVDGMTAILVKADRPVSKAGDASVPESRRVWLQSTKRGTIIVAEQDSEETPPYREKPETLLLPADVKIGSRWDGGAATIEDVPLTLSYEVAGVTDGANDAGVSANCLEVRGYGVGTTRHGTVTARGELSFRRWYAPGIGLVREIRQESLRKTGATGASFERTKMTLRSRLPKSQSHVLAYSINSKEIAKEPVRDNRDLVFGEPPGDAGDTGAGPKYDRAADLAAYQAAREQARSELDSKHDAWRNSGKFGSFDGKASVERVQNADGSVAYKPKVDAQEHAIPTPRVYLGSGGE